MRHCLRRPALRILSAAAAVSLMAGCGASPEEEPPTLISLRDVGKLVTLTAADGRAALGCYVAEIVADPSAPEGLAFSVVCPSGPAARAAAGASPLP